MLTDSLVLKEVELQDIEQYNELLKTGLIRIFVWDLFCSAGHFGSMFYCIRATATVGFCLYRSGLHKLILHKNG